MPKISPLAQPGNAPTVNSARALSQALPAVSASADAARDRELAELLAASAKGDARAFERFYERSVHYAYAAARRIVGDAYAEDVMADAFFQAWREASRYDASRGNAIGWIVTIVRTRALDRARSESLRHGGALGAPAFDEATLDDAATPGPDALLEHTQASTALHRAMASLSANERWCLGLAYFRELSHSEIAATTGLPLGSVKTHISRSQQKLRVALDGESLASARVSQIKVAP